MDFQLSFSPTKCLVLRLQRIDCNRDYIFLDQQRVSYIGLDLFCLYTRLVPEFVVCTFTAATVPYIFLGRYSVRNRSRRNGRDKIIQDFLPEILGIQFAAGGKSAVFATVALPIRNKLS